MVLFFFQRWEKWVVKIQPTLKFVRKMSMKRIFKTKFKWKLKILLKRVDIYFIVTHVRLDDGLYRFLYDMCIHNLDDFDAN